MCQPQLAKFRCSGRCWSRNDRASPVTYLRQRRMGVGVRAAKEST
jgi:hypothetical protein